MSNSAFSICVPPKGWGLGLLRESGKSRLTTSWFDMLPSDQTRYCKKAGIDGAAGCGIGCYLGGVEEEMEKMLDPIYGRWR